MKTVIVTVLLFTASLAVGQEKPVARDYTALFIDNISYKDSGEDFANAFAQESSCSGLTLTLWTSAISQSERLKAMQSAGWWMLYSNSERDGVIGAGGILYREPNGEVDYRRITPFDIEAKTDRAAARKICFVMKGKGGKVR